MESNDKSLKTFLRWRWGVALVLCGILVVGATLRLFQIGDWLHFELDQARDARVIDAALEGSPLDLPLLGPKAGGTFLRLGPGFYWLEYIGALIFGDTVRGSVLMVAFFSLAALPLFYLVARRFFVTSSALLLTSLFSTSAFLVMYGRFAWNPNLIPFFGLLVAYSLLRVVDRHERYPGRWLLSTAFALGLATQMHFLAFLGFPALAGVFLLWRRPRIGFRFWLGALAIIAVLYLPMVLNEIETGGMNTKEFIGAISEKSTKESHPLIEKIVRNSSEFSLHGLVLLTGFEGGAFPAIVIKDGQIGSICDSKCDEGKWYGVAAFVVLALAIVSLIFLWWRETDRRKEDVLLLCGLWFLVTFILFTPLAYGIAPRFFLLNAPVFFLLVGFLARAIGRVVPRRYRPAIGVAGGVVLLILVAFNLFFLSVRFEQLRAASFESVKNAPDRILKERVRVTFEQQNRIVDFLAERSAKNGYPVYMFSEPQYRRALKYLLERRGIENAVLGFDGVYRQGVYFVILRTNSDHEDGLRKYRTHYILHETIPFGTLTAFELIPKPESILGERQDFSPVKQSDSKAPPRYTLRQFIERNQASLTGDEDDPDEDIVE